MILDARKKKNRIGILKALNTSTMPMHSHQIAASLHSQGIVLSDRSVRMYLSELEQEGYTFSDGRKGHGITESGRDELGGERVIERIGYISAQVERMMYLMDFDLASRAGHVLVNMSFVPLALLRDRMHFVQEVFAQGYAMGTLMGLLEPGQHLGGRVVPAGHVGLCTVCSITLSGILLKHGIPVRSLYCGLLDVESAKPRRIKELIAYESTTVDPLKLFINSGMTDYLGAIKNGNGRIGIGYREAPAECHRRLESIAQKVRKVGLGAFMQIGIPNTPLLNLPVHEGCCGMLVIGGLNPIAVFVEAGFRIESHALCGLMDYEQLFPYSELGDRVRDIS